MLAATKALGLEVRHGMKMSRNLNPFKICKELLDLNDIKYKNTKADVLEKMETILNQQKGQTNESRDQK